MAAHQESHRFIAFSTRQSRLFSSALNMPSGSGCVRRLPERRSGNNIRSPKQILGIFMRAVESRKPGSGPWRPDGTDMPERRLRIGVAGLGRAFTLMLRPRPADPRLELLPRPTRAPKRPGALPRTSARGCTRRSTSFAPTRRRGVLRRDAASASRRARRAGAARGKHMLVEKPMAITLEECAACRRGRACQRVSDRRPQPQLRSPHSRARARSSTAQRWGACG